MTSGRHLILVAAAALLLSGCGGGEDDAPVADSPSGNAQTTAPPAEASCGEVADKVEQHVRQERVRSVTVAGQCTSVSIETSLTDDESATAKEICDAAAEVAYFGDTNSIRVLGASGKELSVGISDAPCLEQP
ncbi:hypothetical protein OG884_06925 [Streptosporangium sp. NBC_01755]|uniref:hypothetical protein n=1 Tax=unclassified Streptosporangium TaxID=2632669 RepID=UPI002DDA2A85|nr:MULTISPECIES: hypothetical protein [unclassified Streptosporangium]WSA26923.1 hypothetical protein OIE13_03225 [Streptosporangium sp. NBC_01810]WSD01652.1 hypothetical protein OG884_06925 [Streptosporangium sp. NBC_01755]